MERLCFVIKNLTIDMIEFGEVMAEVGRTQLKNHLMKKTSESINEIFKNISNSQGDQETDKADKTVEENDDDDDFFSNEVFLAVVVELEKTITKMLQNL